MTLRASQHETLKLVGTYSYGATISDIALGLEPLISWNAAEHRLCRLREIGLIKRRKGLFTLTPKGEELK